MRTFEFFERSAAPAILVLVVAAGAGIVACDGPQAAGPDRANREEGDGVLPETKDLHSLVVRTDFSDDAAWATVQRELAAPRGEFQAFLEFVDDERFSGLTAQDFVDLAESGTPHDFVFLADARTMTDPEHPALIVSFEEFSKGETFRVLPKAMWDVQINLTIANTGWEDYTVQLDDGIYRGIPGF